MKKPVFKMFNLFFVPLLLQMFATESFAQSARFAGGSCASQGDWVQGALEQSELLVRALETLKNDPNCNALVSTLNNSESLKEMTSQMGQNVETQGMAGIFSELQAIGSYLNPDKSSLGSGNFREIINYMVFRKSLDTIKDINVHTAVNNMSSEQQASLDFTSQKLRSFIERSSMISKVAVSTTTNILSAFPKHKLCFNNQPNAAATIFSSVVGAAAALATGGQISNVSEMAGALLQFNREIKFADILSGIELEKYRASMSCLVESTQESYCTLQDAQQALDFSRGVSDGKPGLKGALEYRKGIIETPMMGLMILLRDIPIITGWMQKVLFGIDPQLIVEAQMKNQNWESFANFMMASNNLPAVYRDKKRFYIESTKGQSATNKAANLREIIDLLTQTMAQGGGRGAADINFFTTTLAPEAIPFFLMGKELPADYNAQTRNINTIWLDWVRTGSNGLSDPDSLLPVIEAQLNKLIELAGTQFSRYFSSRMIVDPHNLIIEGMNGPSISPYKALLNVRQYLIDLKAKLNAGLKNPKIADNKANADAFAAMVPLLDDTVSRIDKITNSMKGLTQKGSSDDTLKTELASKETMDVIYESANMLLSRDSFLATRLTNAVRMDISDTLWRGTNLNTEQEKLMLSMGKEIITQLSLYFTKDPVLQRLDISQAQAIQNENVAGVEELFVRNYFDQILEINCKIYGGKHCGSALSQKAPDHSVGTFWKALDAGIDAFGFLMTAKSARNLYKDLTAIPTEDSTSIHNQKARLCIQSLGFPKYYKKFKKICNGTKIISEFSDETDKENLNISYDEVLDEMNKLQSEKQAGYLTKTKAKGICALRSYVRKNTVYLMYKELQAAQ